ncbi:MAG: flagellar motor protein MotA [Pseudomonadota bacterium]|nr:flagellar motor protein MotA [Pseudomonadota bacterium]
MATKTFHTTLTRPLRFLRNMLLFLAIVAFVCVILHQQIVSAFMTNPGLNGLIVGVLVIGIAYSFRQVLLLFREIRWVNDFRVADPGIESKSPPVLLAPMATMLRDRTGHLSLSTLSMRSILDSIGTRLDEARDLSRYLVGLLIFLGLLGTFWGLLETISSIGTTIGSLNSGASDSVVIFEELKSGLEAPLKGMGTAFSSSLFGLAGSLVLGFLDLQAGQAQNRFYNELEDWLSGITELQLGETISTGGQPQVRLALLDMQRAIIELGGRIEKGVLNDNSTAAVRDLAKGVEKLIDQMRAEQAVVREWADEQAQQQQELAKVLKRISDSARVPSRITDKGKDK